MREAQERVRRFHEAMAKLGARGDIGDLSEPGITVRAAALLRARMLLEECTETMVALIGHDETERMMIQRWREIEHGLKTVAQSAEDLADGLADVTVIGAWYGRCRWHRPGASVQRGHGRERAQDRSWRSGASRRETAQASRLARARYRRRAEAAEGECAMKPSRKAREEAGGKSFDGFSLPPHAIVVIGVDTQDGPEHPLYSQRAVDLAAGRVDCDDRIYRSIRSKGVLQPIRVRLEPIGKDGALVHVVVAGRHRVLHGRRAVNEMFAAGEIKDRASWQIKCVLEHAKTPRELVATAIDENVCRRAITDDERADDIQRGLGVGFTLDEMADQHGIPVAKARRLLARSEGAPAKAAKDKPKRVPGACLTDAASHLRNGLAQQPQDCRGEDIAALIDVVRGKMALTDATPWVRALLEPEKNG